MHRIHPGRRYLALTKTSGVNLTVAEVVLTSQDRDLLWLAGVWDIKSTLLITVTLVPHQLTANHLEPRQPVVIVALPEPHPAGLIDLSVVAILITLDVGVGLGKPRDRLANKAGRAGVAPT